jgi:hypothetical protein
LHGVAACGPEVQFMGKAVQTLERAIAPKALEPRAHWIEDRMS